MHSENTIELSTMHTHAVTHIPTIALVENASRGPSSGGGGVG